ncbi:hypothetical protein LTR04_000939 [Oleoguttula sp. CCFEE 6159]|nr:hypothetical protein LTR04_000939 [Oleoguttula sp. CCFEE 6159]
MATVAPPSRQNDSSAFKDAPAKDNNRDPEQKKQSRKRTKTGCLTCRKRRIKCGEERPICGNCIKSKRHCEGYNQRVVFKPPTIDHRAGQQRENTIPYHTGVIPNGQGPPPRLQSLSATPLPHDQRRPTSPAHYAYSSIQFAPTPVSGTTYGAGYGPVASLPEEAFYAQHYAPLQYLPNQGTPFSQQHAPAMYAPPSLPREMKIEPHTPSPLYQEGSYAPQGMSSNTASHGQYDHVWLGPNPSYQAPQQPNPHEQSAAFQHYQPHGKAETTPFQGPYTSASPHSGPAPHTLEHSGRPSMRQESSSEQSWQPGSFIPRPELSVSIDQQPLKEFDAYYAQYPTPTDGLPTTPNPPYPSSTVPLYGRPIMEHFATEGHLSSTQILEEAAVEYEDDDYYDVESDEEMDVDSAHSVILRENSRQTFSMMLAIHQARTDELSVRRYDSVIYDGMLDSYRAEWVATPLKNPQTARVFAHFIYATGPSLSIYERHPRNSSVMFSEGPVPLSQQGLWTYTMPMAALHHQGLLHAMLALASLHIAKLQGASSTPSFKHYAYALKRVHSAVGHPKKRLLITTLAASLLLGFYEVMTADHIKWSSHLHGAKQLVAEIPWADMTADFKRMKAERAAYHRYQSELVSHHIMDPQYADDSHLDQLPEIDQRFLDELSGKRYDGSGRVLGETARERTSSFIPGTLDLSKFEILKDLYWWYCKQDVFQSIVSGNNLLWVAPFKTLVAKTNTKLDWTTDAGRTALLAPQLAKVTQSTVPSIT